jgi:phage-related holin
MNPANFTFYKLFLASLTFLMPIAHATLGIIVLICIDFVTALIASKKNNEKITSNKASKSIYKLLIYVLLLISTLIADKVTGISMFGKAAIFFLITIETYSISEGFQKITSLSFIDFLKTYIQKKVKE